MIYEVAITPFRVENLDADEELQPGAIVIISSKEGTDSGLVLRSVTAMKREVYGKVLRRATDEDLQKLERLRSYEQSCLNELKSAIQEHNLAMKPVCAHCQLDETRVIFYFTADKKIEFHKLHRAISQQLNKRTVIKQIGVRDYTRVFDGIGPCGRRLCCASFLTDIKSISLRMAREQKLYVSPSKISGVCGKLLCCLNFEEDYYTDFQAGRKDNEEQSAPELPPDTAIIE